MTDDRTTLQGNLRCLAKYTLAKDPRATIGLHALEAADKLDEYEDRIRKLSDPSRDTPQMTDKPRVYGNGKRVTWWRELIYPIRLALRAPRPPGPPPKFCRYCGRPYPTGEKHDR